jgi:hypothetical protein
MRHSNYPICLLCQPIFQIENCWRYMSKVARFTVYGYTARLCPGWTVG